MTTRVEIPGGFAILRDQEELRGRDRNLIKAAAMAAGPAIEKMPDAVSEGKLEGESEEDMQARLAAQMEGVHLTWQESLALLELRSPPRHSQQQQRGQQRGARARQKKSKNWRVALPSIPSKAKHVPGKHEVCQWR